MTSKIDQEEKLRRLLRAAHRARDNRSIDDQWTQQTMRRIRQLAASDRRGAVVDFWELYFWRWFTAGGVATVVLALLLINFQFVPDADLWSYLVYENETMNMLQALLY
jgi:hypothetical protein